MADSRKIISPEFKAADHTVILITPQYDENALPVFESVKECFLRVESLIEQGKAEAVWSVASAACVQRALQKCALATTSALSLQSSSPTTYSLSPAQAPSL